MDRSVVVANLDVAMAGVDLYGPSCPELTVWIVKDVFSASPSISPASSELPPMVESTDSVFHIFFTSLLVFPPRHAITLFCCQSIYVIAASFYFFTVLIINVPCMLFV